MSETKMTLEDVKNLVKDLLGEEIADLRDEMTKQGEKATNNIQMFQQVQPAAPPEKGMRAARWLRAMAASKGDTDKASKIALDKFKDEEVSKALAASDFEGGGAIVPDEYVAEVIELLRAKTVVRSLGARPMPMNSGSLTMPFLSSGSSAAYVGENNNISKSEPEFGQLQLSAKKLAGLVPISNDLLRDSSPNVDNIVRDDMVQTLGLREDLAFIRDDGTENKPKGMRHWADTVRDRTTDGALANVVTDLSTAVRTLEQNDVDLVRGGWAMSPRTKWHLMSLLDGNGNYVFRGEMLGGNLMTFPFQVTTQIPNNLSTLSGVVGSELYFADFNSLIIGENTQLLVDVFPGGAYHDGSAVVSGISSDQTVMRILARHDFGARHRGKEIIVTNVDWGG